MKNFLTSMFGTLVGLLIFCFGAFLLAAGLIGAVAALGARRGQAGPLQAGTYLVLNLSTNITDSPPTFDFEALRGEGNRGQQLRLMVRAIRSAGTDPNIAGILLTGSLDPSGYGSGYASLREIRNELIAFKRSHKPVDAYLDLATTRDYYLASAADRIFLNPYGMILMPGLAVRSPFLAGALQRYGVGVQIVRVGKYKSAVEPLVRSDMSPENREEYQKLLDDLWGSLLRDMGQSRKIAPQRIQAAVDAEGFIPADTAKQAGLVDRVAYHDQVIDELKAATGAKDKLRQVTLSDYEKRLAAPLAVGSRAAVAVVYAEGDIVEGENRPGSIGGEEFARALRRLREDNSVKAVVLRVNSPGGSATASEEIGRELRLLKAAGKPLVVSMGAYAASGGYWISAPADRIFAEPTTITGSIGVFGLAVDVQKLANDHGVTFDGVKTGRFADILSVTRPKTDAELAMLQRRTDWFYGQFISRVAEGRRLAPARVEEIAQGRVWSGAAALKIGLVDQMGGLSDAVRYAGERAGLGRAFRVTEYPQKKDLAQALAELFGRISQDETSAAGPLGNLAAEWSQALASLRAFNDPQAIYARLPLDCLLR